MIRLVKKEGGRPIDVPVGSENEVKDAALKLAGKVDLFMTTTDTLMQSGGEQALIEISLDKKIPVISSNKNGIEQGSTLGVVADFYMLGAMAGEIAVRILKENIPPFSIQSRIQEPPLILVNKKSANLLNICIPEDELPNLRYVE